MWLPIIKSVQCLWEDINFQTAESENLFLALMLITESMIGRGPLQLEPSLLFLSENIALRAQ